MVFQKSEMFQYLLDLQELICSAPLCCLPRTNTVLGHEGVQIQNSILNNSLTLSQKNWKGYYRLWTRWWREGEHLMHYSWVWLYSILERRLHEAGNELTAEVMALWLNKKNKIKNLKLKKTSRITHFLSRPTWYEIVISGFQFTRQSKLIHLRGFSSENYTI